MKKATQFSWNHDTVIHDSQHVNPTDSCITLILSRMPINNRGYAVLFVCCILVVYRVEGQGEGLAMITDVTYSSQTTTSEEKEASGSKEDYQRIQVRYTYEIY